MDNDQDLQFKLSEVSNHELMALYDQFEAGSADFLAVREEMNRRGFKFQTLEEVSQPPREQTQAAPKTLRYSQGWSLFGELLFAFMGILLFVALMESSDWKPKPQLALVYILAALMVCSLGALVSGARNLANRKTGLPEAIRSGGWQSILGGVWTLAGVAALLFGGWLVSQTADGMGEMAPYLAIFVVAVCLVCAAFAITLITLGREMGSED